MDLGGGGQAHRVSERLCRSQGLGSPSVSSPLGPFPQGEAASASVLASAALGEPGATSARPLMLEKSLNFH